jgi:hypothetical protein
MENTPIHIKSSLSRRIFDQNQKEIQILNDLTGNYWMGKKTISRYCPFKYLDFDIVRCIGPYIDSRDTAGRPTDEKIRG